LLILNPISLTFFSNIEIVIIFLCALTSDYAVLVIITFVMLSLRIRGFESHYGYIEI
jgi:hypothetical protein